MSYAIIRLGGKQFRVQEGDRILVDRLGQDEGKSFHPDVLLFADNGKTELAPKGVQVTAKIVSHTLGKKVRIGKYRPKSGYRRHTGHRSRLTEIQIEKLGKKAAARKATPKTEEAKAEEKPATKSGAKKETT